MLYQGCRQKGGVCMIYGMMQYLYIHFTFEWLHFSTKFEKFTQV